MCARLNVTLCSNIFECNFKAIEFTSQANVCVTLQCEITAGLSTLRNIEQYKTGTGPLAYIFCADHHAKINSACS